MYNQPLVSVIMPAYNAQQYIAEAIESVIAQTYSNWELIIVNDGSTDDTLHIISHYQQNDSRIKIIDQLNSRLGAARNTALRVAKGKYIAFLDADDWWHCDKLKLQMEILFQHPGIGVCYTNGYLYQEGEFLDPYPILIGLRNGYEVYNQEYTHNMIVISSVIMKAEAILHVGPQEESAVFLGCEDLDYWIRAASMDYSFYGLDKRLFHYRIHQNNMSGNVLGMLSSQAGVLIKNYDKSLLNPKVKSQFFQPFILYAFFKLLRSGKWTESWFLYTQGAKIIKPFWFISLVYLFKRIYHRLQKLFIKF